MSKPLTKPQLSLLEAIAEHGLRSRFDGRGLRYWLPGNFRVVRRGTVDALIANEAIRATSRPVTTSPTPAGRRSGRPAAAK